MNNNIIIENWFSLSIFTKLCNSINVKELENFSYNLKNNNKGRISTNINSWQSDDLNLNDPIFFELKNEIIKNCNILHKELSLKNIYTHIIQNIWINVHPNGGGNVPHVHNESIFSGVFYIKNAKNSGRLVFTHPAANHSYHLNEPVIEKWTNKNSGICYQIPQVSKMVIFPSWANHYVEPNTSNEDRISIAFNTKLIEIE